MTAAQTASGHSVDAGEIARFNALADEWWDPRGPMAPLHRLNPLRLAWLRDALCAKFGRDPLGVRPLAGLRLLDVGCGAGLLSEPLARLGADVTGIDAAAENIRTAQAHALRMDLAIDYRAVPAEALAAAGERFDGVLAMEVVEHVSDVPFFLGTLGGLARPGDLVALSTLNRTARSFALGVVAAEYVLRWVPRGTHDWRKFVRPSELAGGLRRAGVAVRDMTGVVYDPLRDEFRLDRRDLAVNYMLWGEKAA